MLRTRVITALVLLALLLPSLYLLPPSYWALLVAAFIGIAAWEWGGLLCWPENSRRILGMVTALVCAMLSLLDPGVVSGPGLPDLAPTWVMLFYGAAAVFWCVVIPFWLWKKWALSGGAIGLAVGAVVLLPTWLAMVQLRTLGPGVLLGIFAVVWMADIAAYFSGKAFGKHKLAPAISPGKTWEGALGACLGVIGYGLLVRVGFALERPQLVVWILALVLITAISVVGDLYESLLKRKAGIKDSSNVLPGHGGVLDRIDSLTSTLPIVALLWLLVWHAEG